MTTGRRAPGRGRGPWGTGRAGGCGGNAGGDAAQGGRGAAIWWRRPPLHTPPLPPAACGATGMGGCTPATRPQLSKNLLMYNCLDIWTCSCTAPHPSRVVLEAMITCLPACYLQTTWTKSLKRCGQGISQKTKSKSNMKARIVHDPSWYPDMRLRHPHDAEAPKPLYHLTTTYTGGSHAAATVKKSQQACTLRSSAQRARISEVRCAEWRGRLGSASTSKRRASTSR